MYCATLYCNQLLILPLHTCTLFFSTHGTFVLFDNKFCSFSVHVPHVHVRVSVPRTTTSTTRTRSTPPVPTAYSCPVHVLVGRYKVFIFIKIYYLFRFGPPI